MRTPQLLDAYRTYLEERAEAGGASKDEAVEAAFWRYSRDESMLTFVKPCSDDKAQAFAPWGIRKLVIMQELSS